MKDVKALDPAMQKAVNCEQFTVIRHTTFASVSGARSGIVGQI